MRTEPPNGDELARLLASMKTQLLEQTADEPTTRARESRLRNGVLGALAAVALLLGLGAGAAFAFGLWPADEPRQPQSATATTTTPPSSTPSPAPIEEEPFTAVPAPAPVPAVIEISTEGLAVLAADGSVLGAFDYFEEPTGAIAMLTEYLGEPAVTEVESRGDGFTGTWYDWEGLDLFDDASSPYPPYRAGFGVSVDSTSVAGLALRAAPGIGTPAGVAVGDAVADIAAEESWSEFSQPESGRTGRSTRVGIGEPIPSTETSIDGPHNFGVRLSSFDDTGLVESFGAPSPNFGP